MALNPKRRLLLEALLTARTIDEAIKKAGISSSTAYKYMAEDEFKDELTKQKDESLAHISTRLNQIGHEAVDRLQDVIRDEENATPTHHIQASRAVLEFMYRAKEIEDLEQRLAELEEFKNAFKEY